jgi:enoyl-CoA hydratase/carnithine racemase
MQTQSYEHIEYTEQGRVAFVTMNRPKKRNALSADHMSELLTCVRAIGQRKDISVVIVRGNGPVFSAGHDLGEMLDQEIPFYRRLFEICTDLMEGLQAIPQPVIAQVHGVATAAGCQLVASCDLAVAAEDARFATPGVRIGLFCSTPMIALSRTIPPKKALEMLFTGDFISATEAQQYGLVNQVVPADELETATLALAENISSFSSEVIGLGKQTFYKQQGMTQQQAYAYARETMAFNATFADAHEGIQAFLEKRQPRWSDRSEE